MEAHTYSNINRIDQNARKPSKTVLQIMLSMMLCTHGVRQLNTSTTPRQYGTVSHSRQHHL
jgi:hypothetical protein